MKNVLSIIMLSLGSVSGAQVVPEKLLSTWNFENNPQATYLKEFCEGTVVPEAAVYQGIKALQELSNESTAILRFTLAKQEYYDVATAVKAVAAINNPSRRTSKHSKMCDLRQAFHVGSEVYFVHTDVGQFKKDIKPLLDKLLLYILNIN